MSPPCAVLPRARKTRRRGFAMWCALRHPCSCAPPPAAKARAGWASLPCTTAHLICPAALPPFPACGRGRGNAPERSPPAQPLRRGPHPPRAPRRGCLRVGAGQRGGADGSGSRDAAAATGDGLPVRRPRQSRAGGGCAGRCGAGRPRPGPRRPHAASAGAWRVPATATHGARERDTRSPEERGGQDGGALWPLRHHMPHRDDASDAGPARAAATPPAAAGGGRGGGRPRVKREGAPP